MLNLVGRDAPIDPGLLFLLRKILAANILSATTVNLTSKAFGTSSWKIPGVHRMRSSEAKASRFMTPVKIAFPSSRFEDCERAL